jgi:EpsD family peptidyl-prolyl cis-trans isomerase
MNASKFARLIAVVALAATVAACGKEGESKKETQVAAKVNGSEITVHQVNFALSRLGAVDQAQAKQAQKQVVRSLVDQQLMVAKAQEQKLDRDPQVVQAIEAAKNQILAQAYIERTLSSVAKPGPAEIKDYYAKHPDLFEKRRVFRFQELVVAVKPGNIEAVKAQLSQAKTMDDMIAWLKSQDIKFTGGAAVKTAEQLPLELLPKLNQMKDGQTLVMAAGPNLQILQLVASQEQPVTEDKATPAIERFLLNQKRNELAQAEVKKLRDAAKIEYVGAFADAGAAAPAPAAAAQPAQPQAKPDAGFVDKGLSGLK